MLVLKNRFLNYEKTRFNNIWWSQVFRCDKTYFKKYAQIQPIIVIVYVKLSKTTNDKNSDVSSCRATKYHSNKSHTFVSLFWKYFLTAKSTFHISACIPSLSRQTTQNGPLLLLFSLFSWFVCNLKPFQLYWIFSGYFVASSLFSVLRLIFCFIRTSQTKKRSFISFHCSIFVDFVVLLQRARFSLLFSIHAREHFIFFEEFYKHQ